MSPLWKSLPNFLWEKETLLSLMLWLMGRTDGDKGEVQYTGHYAETDWLGICDPERIQKKKLMWFITIPTKSNDNITNTQGLLPKSSWFTSILMPLLIKAKNGGNKGVTGPCHESCLTASTLSESVPEGWVQGLEAGPLAGLATCPLCWF